MPKVPEDNVEQTLDKSTLTFEEAMKRMVPYSTAICGVNRKINTGNFENIDVFYGLTVPILQVFDPDDLEAFKEASTAAAELGFQIASKETGDRYTIIKELQAGK